LRYHAIAEVAKFFRAADIVVLPYRSASQSAMAQLAFAFGKPVVATRVGGLPEIIEDGWNGLLVNPRDEEALACAIKRLLVDLPLRQSLGSRAAEVAASRHSWDRVAEATLHVYDAVRERRRSQRRLLPD
jgi:glycosyltransferase involved in cell wall biosynthesis